MKHHFYLFVFQEGPVETLRTTSTSMGVKHNRVTQTAINNARIAARVSPTALLFNVSYLGHMTMEEFQTEE